VQVVDSLATAAAFDVWERRDGAIVCVQRAVRGREQTRWTGSARWVAYSTPIKAIT